MTASRPQGLAARAVAVAPITLLVVFLGWFGVSQATDRFWLLLGLQALWTAIAVIGVNLLLGYTGLLSLGHFAFFLYGGFIGAVWSVEGWGLHPWLALPVAVAAGMGLGALLALTCCHLRGFYLTVMTLAFGLLSSSLAVLFADPFNSLSGRAVVHPLDTNFSFLDATNPNRPFLGLYVIGVVLLLGCLAVSRNVVHSRWGRAYQAIRESEVAAKACGVATYRTKVSAFALSAGMESLGGVLAAQTNLQVTMASGTSIVGKSFEQVIYATFGGLGTIAGPVVGAFAFTLGLGVQVGGSGLSDRLGAWQTLFLGVLVIVITIALPLGVVGTLSQRLRPWRARLATAGAGGRQGDVGEADLGPISAPRPGEPVPAGRPLLEVDSIGLAFGGLVALDGVDLSVTAGTVHALIGPNGSGKSTLVNVITGIYRPDVGRVRFDGRDLTGEPAHRCNERGVARTFQTCQVWRKMTVLDNVLVGSHAQTRTGLARSALLPPSLRPDERRIRDDGRSLLAAVGLADKADALAGSLAFVDLRRLEIARALASRPKLLILDEPAAGMAAADVALLEELIGRVRDAGVTVLLIEHHMDLVMRLCDTVTVLDFGRKLSEGAPDAVAADPRVVDAYLGSPGERRALATAAPAGLRPNAGEPDRSGSGAEPLLSVRQLEVAYGAAPALSGVDIAIWAGETVAIIGANGAGKTTTLKAVSGVTELLMSVRGEVIFRGQPIGGLPAHKIARLGLVHVPEGRRVFAESTVEENLLLGAHFRRDAELRADIDAVFDRFPAIARRRAQPAGLLSGGEQQMLAIGRALVARPAALLLDEPSLGLAPTVVDELFAAIDQLSAEGLSILIVEQLAAKALAVADWAYVLETGSVVLSGPAAEVAGDPGVRAAYLGEPEP